MHKTVRIYGLGANAKRGPRDVPPDTEVWLANIHHLNQAVCPHAVKQWTRWFNLHSREHIDSRYPGTVLYWQSAGKPVCLQKAQPDIPTSVAFPREAIQAKFKSRYFNCTLAWLIAYAILEGFNRIELWGFVLKRGKGYEDYSYERPCIAYWIKQARDRGIEVTYQEPIAELYKAGKMVPGDPDAYTGPLYGYSTKPDPDWDVANERWKENS